MNKTRLFQHPIPVLVMAALVLFSAASAASHADAAYAVASAVDFVALPEADAVQDISSRTVVLPGEALDPAAPLPEGTAVLIRADGRELSTVSEGETLSSLLHRLGIWPGPLDTVLADASGEQLMVSIGAEPVGYEQTEEILPYETVRRATPDLPKGQERTVQAGASGKRTITYAVTFFNGGELTRQMVDEQVLPSTEEIIEYGTAAESLKSSDRIAAVDKNEDGSGVLTFRSGATMKFTAVKNVTATAYTAGRGGAGYITAMGTPARVGAVAVDRRVIPLGSKLYIVTDDGKYVYGLAVAEDTGVIGNRVDLYYDDYDACIQFGRRPATIYILED